MRDLNKGGREPECFTALRQMAVLLIADSSDIRTFVDCNGSRFRFNLDRYKLGGMLATVFEYNLSLLTPREEAEHPIRSVERKGLLAWANYSKSMYPALPSS